MNDEVLIHLQRNNRHTHTHTLRRKAFSKSGALNTNYAKLQPFYCELFLPHLQWEHRERREKNRRIRFYGNILPSDVCAELEKLGLKNSA